MPTKHRVVDHIVEHLAAIGIDHIFGVDGANIEDLYDAAHFHPGITAVLAKNEFSAATMADGYGRSGAGLGVVAATSGGGALNLVAGLGEALASRVPVLALVGQTPTPISDLDGFAAAMRAALDVDGPAVVSVECAADEIPPFAPFLAGTAAKPAKTEAAAKLPTAKENRTDVAASA
jgi:acetolactate synthase I/II/III large subunit